MRGVASRARVGACQIVCVMLLCFPNRGGGGVVEGSGWWVCCYVGLCSGVAGGGSVPPGWGQVRGWWVLEESVEVAGDVSFEEAAGFAGGFPLGGSFGDVGAGFVTGPGAGDGDGVDCLVELAVAASVEAVSGPLPGGGFEGCYTGEASERGFVAASGRGGTRRCIPGRR